MHRCLKGIALIALFMGVPSVALADKYDIDYSRLGEATNEGSAVTLVKDQLAFDNVVRDLGVALAPKFMGPASTLGALGFDLAYEISWTDINESEDYWTKALGEQADSMLTTSQLHVRKGLPFSLEIGGTLGHLHQSKIWTVGMDLKYALLEGFRVLPDLAIRSNIHTVLGPSDIHMLLTGGDVILSKEFGLGGLFRLAPFVGYNLVYVYGSSHQVSFFTPTCPPDDAQNNRCSKVDLFEEVGIFEHRGIMGLQLVAAYISMGAEVALSGNIRTYTGHIGVDF